MKASVAGVGINDAWYSVTRNTCYNGKSKQVWKCPFYSVWKSMLERCYGKTSKPRNPSYYDCQVCDEWLVFSKFRSWMSAQDWQGKELDKDIINPGNRIYCPENCVFVDGNVNNFLVDRASRRGNWPIGVSYQSRSKRFLAQCSCQKTNKQKKIGLFSSPEEAHEAWKSFKICQAIEIAKNISDERVAKAIIDRYLNYSQVLEA